MKDVERNPSFTPDVTSANLSPEGLDMEKVDFWVKVQDDSFAERRKIQGRVEEFLRASVQFWAVAFELSYERAFATLILNETADA